MKIWGERIRESKGGERQDKLEIKFICQLELST